MITARDADHAPARSTVTARRAGVSEAARVVVVAVVATGGARAAVGATGRRRVVDRDRPMRDERRPAPEAPTAPAPVRIEFLPDEKCLASITKQIRSTHLAYPLFGLARMFLQEPARHWVQFTVVPEAASAGASLFQLGEDGPVTTGPRRARTHRLRQP